MYIKQPNKPKKPNRPTTWFAYHDLPKSLHAHFGKSRLKVSLETTDENEAKRRSRILWEEWSHEIAAARGGSTEAIEARAKYWHAVITRAKSDSAKAVATELMDEELHDRAVRAASRAGLNLENPDEAAEFDQSDDAGTLSRVRKMALGKLRPIEEQLGLWEAWLKNNDDKERTIFMKLATVRKFAKRHPFIEDFSIENLQAWIDGLRKEKGRSGDKRLSWTTIKKNVSELRSFWNFLKRTNHVAKGYNPFDGLQLAPSNKEAGGELREDFEAADVLRLRKAAFDAGEETLGYAIWIAMYSGARLNEICNLKAEHIFDDHFSIVAGKTKASIRKMPIHPMLRPVLTKLREASSSNDGYLLNIQTDNKFNDRGKNISKKFRALRDDLGGFTKGQVFHSLRHTVAQLLTEAEVDDSKSGALLGHQGKTLVGKKYIRNNKIKVAVKAEWLAKLDYGEKKIGTKKKGSR